MRTKNSYPLWWMLLGVLVSLPVSAASGAWDFRVFLDDKEIGSHRFEVLEDAGTKTLTSKARFNVKFLFVNAYSYDHEATESWDGNCLTRLTSRTDDNGTEHLVEARRRSSDTTVQTTQGIERLGECIMTFAYWNPAMLAQSRLLNSQNGEYVDVTIEERGKETINVRGVSTESRRYVLRGDKLTIDLWYSNENEWLALESLTEQGRRLIYRLR